mmetsp:Transcript_34499/g.85943  ORF Transcript_34499/g.85943 Transcript_34499/m.85943 type:complete len:232 (+) Transcript_34499:1193-1888(+)
MPSRPQRPQPPLPPGPRVQLWAAGGACSSRPTACPCPTSPSARRSAQTRPPALRSRRRWCWGSAWSSGRERRCSCAAATARARRRCCACCPGGGALTPARCACPLAVAWATCRSGRSWWPSTRCARRSSTPPSPRAPRPPPGERAGRRARRSSVIRQTVPLPGASQVRASCAPHCERWASKRSSPRPRRAPAARWAPSTRPARAKASLAARRSGSPPRARRSRARAPRRRP